MYIRTHEQALDALADLLDLGDRRAQIVQSTVKVMLCVHEEPRRFMADAQALLIQGGLDALKRRRREHLDAQEDLPLIVLDPEGDLYFEAAAGALDALRLAETVRQVFPGLLQARWIVARALLNREADVKALLADGIRARGEAAALCPVSEALERVLVQSQPTWADEEEALRSACREILLGAGLTDALRVDEEASALFEILAVDEPRCLRFRESLGAAPEEAVNVAIRLYEGLDAVRQLPDPVSRAARDAA